VKGERKGDKPIIKLKIGFGIGNTSQQCTKILVLIAILYAS